MYSLHLQDFIDDPWYCTELIAGDEWNETIQAKFNEVDIIFFMISENLMSTQYVLDHEIKNAIARYDKDKSLKIVPILLVHYDWKLKGGYDLSRFVALPFTLKPVCAFDDQHTAWYTIQQAVKFMIDKDIDPLNTNTALTSEIKRIYEEIIDSQKPTQKPS